MHAETLQSTMQRPCKHALASDLCSVRRSWFLCMLSILSSLIFFCRCFPAFDSATLSEVVTVLGLRNYSSSSAASLYSKSFGSSGQRLQRYIADIHKGILIILVSGLLLRSSAAMHHVSYHAMPCHTIPHHTIPEPILSYHIISYHNISYHVTSFPIISYGVM